MRGAHESRIQTRSPSTTTLTGRERGPAVSASLRVRSGARTVRGWECAGAGVRWNDRARRRRVCRRGHLRGLDLAFDMRDGVVIGAATTSPSTVGKGDHHGEEGEAHGSEQVAKWVHAAPFLPSSECAPHGRATAASFPSPPVEAGRRW